MRELKNRVLETALAKLEEELKKEPLNPERVEALIQVIKTLNEITSQYADINKFSRQVYSEISKIRDKKR